MKTRSCFPAIALAVTFLFALAAAGAAAEERSRTPTQVRKPLSTFQRMMMKNGSSRATLQPAPADEENAEAEQPSKVRRMLSLDNLLGRFRRHEPVSSEASEVENEEPSEVASEEPAAAEETFDPLPDEMPEESTTPEEPSEAAEVHFPDFQSGEEMAEPATLESPEPSPAMLLSHQTEPLEAASRLSNPLRANKEPSKLPAPSSRTASSSTLEFLTEEVRFGHVLRKPQFKQTVERTNEPERHATTGREAEHTTARLSPASLDSIFLADDGHGAPELLPPRPDDVSSLHVPLPTPASAFSGALADQEARDDSAGVSSGAGPAALQQALRHFGAPTVSEESVRNPASAEAPPAKKPAPQQRSVQRNSHPSSPFEFLPFGRTTREPRSSAGLARRASPPAK
jgi:hypothetical protein